jgi:hypothetical protein
MGGVLHGRSQRIARFSPAHHNFRHVNWLTPPELLPKNLGLEILPGQVHTLLAAGAILGRRVISARRRRRRKTTMFTIKYRSFVPAATQNAEPGSPTLYDCVEQISGGYDFVSQEIEDGYMVVHAHRGGDPGMTFGPCKGVDRKAGEAPPPRPTVYVMNDTGATVAKYDL